MNVVFRNNNTLQCKVDRRNVPLRVVVAGGTTIPALRCNTNRTENISDVGCFVIPHKAVNVTLSVEGGVYTGGPLVHAWECYKCNVSITNVRSDGLRWTHDDEAATFNAATSLQTIDYSQVYFRGEDSELRINNCSFVNASQAIWARSMSRVEIRNVMVENVHGIGTIDTAAINIRTITNIVIDQLSMLNSSASETAQLEDSFGGCLAVEAYTAVLKDSSFIGCTAQGVGGGFALTVTTGIIENINIVRSTSKMTGGGFAVMVFGTASLVIRNVRAIGVAARLSGAGFSIAYGFSSKRSIIYVSNTTVESEGGNGCFSVQRNSGDDDPSDANKLQLFRLELRKCRIPDKPPQKTFVLQDIHLLKGHYTTKKGAPITTYDRDIPIEVMTTHTRTVVVTSKNAHQLKSNSGGAGRDSSSFPNAVVALAAIASVLSHDGTSATSMEGAMFIGMSSCTPISDSPFLTTSNESWISAPLQSLFGRKSVFEDDADVDAIFYNVVLASGMVTIPPMVMVILKRTRGSSSSSWTQLMNVCRYPSVPFLVASLVLQGSMYHVTRALSVSVLTTPTIVMCMLCLVLYPIYITVYPVLWHHRLQSQNGNDPTTPEYQAYPLLSQHLTKIPFLQHILPYSHWHPTAHRHIALYLSQPGRLVEVNTVVSSQSIAVGCLAGAIPSQGTVGSAGCVGVLSGLCVVFSIVGLYLLLRRPMLSMSLNVLRGVGNLLNGVVCAAIMLEAPTSSLDGLLVLIYVLSLLDIVCVTMDYVYLYCFFAATGLESDDVGGEEESLTEFPKHSNQNGHLQQGFLNSEQQGCEPVQL